VSGPQLVVDNTNVQALPVEYLRDIALAARGFADAVEAGQFEGLTLALLITVQDGQVDYAPFGDDLNGAEALGYLELAKVKVIADLSDA
jgi:hypothetical protein